MRAGTSLKGHFFKTLVFAVSLPVKCQRLLFLLVKNRGLWYFISTNFNGIWQLWIDLEELLGRNSIILMAKWRKWTLKIINELTKKKARPCYHVRGRYPALSHKSGLCGTSFPVLFRAANCNLSCGLLELCQDKSAIRNAVSPSWGRRCTSQCRCGSHCLGWFWNGLTHRVARGLPVVCTKIGSSSLYPVGPEEKTNDSRRQVVKCTLAKQHGLWRLQMCKLTVNSLSTTAIIRARHSCAAWRVK